jgi:hypothetical protein
MKKEKLYEAIGEINENYICEAHQTTKRKPNRAWLQICAMAACFALIVGLGIGGFNSLKEHNGDLPGEVLQNPTQQGTSKDNHNTDTVIDNPIILWNAYSEVQDAGFTEWNGKTITLSLYDALSDTKNKDSLIAIGVGFEIDTNFVYNGKSLAEYALEADAERLLGGKLGQLLKLGDSLKYGDALYKTGTPTGEKWAKELYDETVETIGKDLIAKYIVDGEFLVEKLEADIAACSENEPCRIAYEEALNAFYRAAVDEVVKILEEQNISYEKRNETGLVFFITADQFVSFHLDNVSHFGFASKDVDGMDFVEESTDD